MLFFFDTSDGDDFFQDNVGIDLPDAKKAKLIAECSLAELLGDAVHRQDFNRKMLAVEVRDADHRHLLRASIWFETTGTI